MTRSEQMERLRRRWVATSQRDFRSPGNRAAYRRAYDAYYNALGVALGYSRSGGYFEAPDGTLPGINDMEVTYAQATAQERRR